MSQNYTTAFPDAMSTQSIDKMNWKSSSPERRLNDNHNIASKNCWDVENRRDLSNFLWHINCHAQNLGFVYTRQGILYKNKFEVIQNYGVIHRLSQGLQ